MLAGSQPLALGATPSADQSFLVVLRPQESLLAIMSEDWSCSILSPKESQDISNNPDEERARHSGGKKVSVCMCVHIYVCTYVCAHMYVHTHVYLCMNCECVCALVRVCTYGCMCVYLHMHVYIYVCVCAHVCAHLLSMCAPVFSG